MAGRLAVLLSLMVASLAVAQAPQPGLVPTVTETVETAGETTGADDAAHAVIEVFHGLATPPTRLPYMTEPAGINDDAWETTRTGMDAAIRVPTHHDLEGGLAGFAVGATYTLAAGGTYDYYVDQHGYWGDAECSQAPGDPVWRPHRYGPDYVDLVVAEAGGAVVHFDWVPDDPWPAASGHDPACSRDHNYTATWTAGATWGRFVVDDPQRADNHGELRVRATGPAPVYDVHYQCPKHAITPWDGVARQVGELESATVKVDARRNANDVPYPESDPSYSFWNETGHNGAYTCAWLAPWSTYDLTVTGTYTYVEDHPLNQPLQGHGGVWVGGTFVDLHGQRLPEDLPAPLADAECSQGLLDPLWLSHREGHAVRWEQDEPEFGTDYLDLTLNELWVKWFPANGQGSGCDETHTYVIEDWRPDRLGPLHLWIKDKNYAEHDNRGHLTVTVTRTS